LIIPIAADIAIVNNKAKVTEEQVMVFLDICWKKYVKAKIEPGKLAYALLFYQCL